MRTLLAAACLLLALPASAGASVADKKNDAEKVDGTVVSHLSDERIVEASGMAMSAKFPDLAYVINDSNNQPVMFAIKVSTGQTVGRTILSGFDVADTESLYVDPYGHVWLGDLGDNQEDRHDVSIVAFTEPGPGNFDLDSALRFPIAYRGGPINVEAMLIQPITGEVFLIHKDKAKRATVYRVAYPLKNGRTNLAVPIGAQMPAFATDGVFTKDGRRALVRTETDVWVFDPETWTVMNKLSTPKMKKSETITLDPGDESFIVGSEGNNSPLVRFAMPPDPRPVPTDIVTAGALSQMTGFEPLTKPKSTDTLGIGFLLKLAAISGVAVLAVGALWLRITARRRRRPTARPRNRDG